VPNLTSKALDASRLLLDLKLCGALVQRFAGSLEPDAIATCVTDGLVEQFGCAFTRIWLVEPDRTALRLVASSGLYTRLDGAFARVPMGAFKVGKIAQHCIPFLSNCLPEEAWVKDRTWAIQNQIQGFAGLPLMVQSQAIGVLAVFSHTPMAPEFLEVLQSLSLSVTSALASALNHQNWLVAQLNPAQPFLSEQLATLLGTQKLSLLGTEHPLPPIVNQLLLQTGQQLASLACQYCRLVYDEDRVILEAVLSVSELSATSPQDRLQAIFQEISLAAAQLGGALATHLTPNQQVIQLRLILPQQSPPPEPPATAAETGASPLSDREREVITLLAQGLRDREIAEQLHISERTVKFHVKNGLDKLNVRTRIQGVFQATQKGWLG
jgi:DNA-binding CsgD family transcriptional regulator